MSASAAYAASPAPIAAVASSSACQRAASVEVVLIQWFNVEGDGSVRCPIVRRE
jgi:hypothetical protein